jgi:hypothetical protein
MSIDCICTSPGNGRIGVLAPRCWQLFLNNRPILAPKKLTHIVNDLYKDWPVADGTIPYFLMHVKA